MTTKLKTGISIILILLLAVALLTTRFDTNDRLPAPTFSLPDLAGKEHQLSDYRGRVLMVNFWATWCPPCRAEMPSLWRLQHKVNNPDFRVIAINMGEDRALVSAFLPGPMLQDFVILLDKYTSSIESWRVTAFPTSFLVDRNGHIVTTVQGALEWDQPEMIDRVNRLLAEQDSGPTR